MSLNTPEAATKPWECFTMAIPKAWNEIIVF